MPLIIPPALKFPLPVIKPLRTPTEIQEVTGKAVGWKTSEFRLVYKGYELREFSKALASGMTQRAALKHALNATRLKQVGGQMNQTIEAAKLAALPEVGRAVARYKDKFRRAHLMDMIERRGHCARVARRSSTAPNAVINAVLADAKLAGELDDSPKVDVTFNQVLANVQALTAAAGGNGLLPTEGERLAIEAKLKKGLAALPEQQAIEVDSESVTEAASTQPQAHPLDGARVVAEIELDDEEPQAASEVPAVFGEIETEAEEA